jgi:hypothetical protein
LKALYFATVGMSSNDIPEDLKKRIEGFELASTTSTLSYLTHKDLKRELKVKL